MGIRFHCQHCHKRLNVKKKQAGVEGQCPHCLGKILVPTRSTISTNKYGHRQGKPRNLPSSHSGDSSIGLHDVDSQSTQDGLPAELRHAQATDVDKQNSDPSSFESESGERSASLFMLEKPQLPATLGKVDPIAESPSRIWYFRSRMLGEKGPLKGKAMQQHLDRGDVCVGCIVWRDDWNDWIPAEKVFPKLVAEVQGQSQKSDGSKRRTSDSLTSRLDSGTDQLQRKRQLNQIFIAAIAGGVFIILILLVVLLNLLAEG